MFHWSSVLIETPVKHEINIHTTHIHEVHMHKPTPITLMPLMDWCLG